ncbi:MAG: DUF1553 domain-containing protein, partial [Verrucomicrobiales bacterium]|nr:DUF1553 domain-containing protein [Verrucomicrobiales bacterium]
RCHDHKFDPISQTEYYQFVSALSGIRHGEKEYRDTAAENRAAQLKAEVSALDESLAKLDQPAIARVLEIRKNSPAPQPDPPAALYTWQFDRDFSDTTGKLPGRAFGGARIEAGALSLSGDNTYAETDPLPVPLLAKTLEAVVQLSDLDQRGGGVISVQNKSGVIFDAIVYGERKSRAWMAGSNGFTRSQNISGDEETEASLKQPLHIAVVYHESGKIERYRNGQLYGESYDTGIQPYAAGDTVIQFGIRHPPTGTGKHLKGKILEAKLYGRALHPDEVALAAGAQSNHVAQAEIIATLDGAERTRRAALVAERESLQAKLEAVDLSARGKVYSVNANPSPGVTKFLLRGNAMDEGKPVAPGAISAVQGVDADLGLAGDAPDAERRKRLAAWITGENNPLFARVIVNRLWHYHFGAGIVETPNDLGYNGGRPSHPGLLDWLAAEIVDRDWSLKSVHRLIVNSTTYRQASRPRPDAIAKDADNRLLWRKSPVRIDAESLRDAMLSVSGKLNPKQGGPGFRDVKIDYNEGTTYYHPFDEENDEFHRRTVYRFSPRGGRSAILDTFDCPDPANSAPRRTVTTTPLQALALLNNSFALRIGDHFAQRIAGSGITTAYRLAFGRNPDPSESEIAEQLVQEHGFTALARVLFNSNEFVIIE